MLELLKYKNLAYQCIYVCYSQSKSGVRGPEACVDGRAIAQTKQCVLFDGWTEPSVTELLQSQLNSSLCPFHVWIWVNSDSLHISWLNISFLPWENFWNLRSKSFFVPLLPKLLPARCKPSDGNRLPFLFWDSPESQGSLGESLCSIPQFIEAAWEQALPARQEEGRVA